MKTKLFFILCASSFATFSQQELIQNGSFEQGEVSWDFTGATDAYGDFGACDASDGDNYLWFGDADELTGLDDIIYDGVEQDVTLPANLDYAEFSFYWSGGSDEQDDIDEWDFLYFVLYDQAGNEIYADSISNADLDVTITAADCDPIWNLEGFTIPSTYAGQTMTILFEVLTDDLNPTLFRVDEVSVLAFTTSGLEEMEQSFVSVSPNPAENSLNIKSSTTPIGEIKIVDVSGNIVMNLEFNSYSADIEVSNINKGVYFIMNNEGKRNKFIKI